MAIGQQDGSPGKECLELISILVPSSDGVHDPVDILCVCTSRAQTP